MGRDITDVFLAGESPEALPTYGDVVTGDRYVDLTPLLPTGSWLKDYVDWAVECTDAPANFHVGCGLTALGAVIGKRAHITPWGHPMYPIFWSLCLAQSSVGRKSTALNLARGIVRRAESLLQPVVLGTDWTWEALIVELQKHAARMLVASEFGALLRQWEKGYMVGVKEALTDAFDGGNIEQIRKGTWENPGTKVTIESPTISLLGASTVEWWTQNLQHSDVHGGFTQRFLYFTGKPGKLRALGVEREEHEEEFLAEGLRRLKQIPEGRCLQLHDTEAAEIYTAWFETFAQDGSSHRARLVAYALKIGLALTLSENPLAERLEPANMERATQLITALAETFEVLEREEFNYSKEAQRQGAAFRLVRHNPGIQPGELARELKWSRQHTEGVVRDLIFQQRIQQEETDHGLYPTVAPGGNVP